MEGMWPGNMEWELGDLGGKMEMIREGFIEEVEMLFIGQYSLLTFLIAEQSPSVSNNGLWKLQIIHFIIME